MIAKGQITFILRDATTMEVVQEHKINNIVTDEFYKRFANTLKLNDLKLVINGKQIAPSRWTKQIPGNTGSNSARYPDTTIPGRSYFEFFNAAGAVDAFMQYSGRFNAPSAARSFRTLILTNGYSQGNLDGNEPSISAMAYASLTTTCVQETNQVLDVYYRLFFPIAEGPSAPLLKEMLARAVQSQGGESMINNHHIYPTPVVTKLVAGDELLAPVAVAGVRFDSIFFQNMTSYYNGYGHRTASMDTAFGDNIGMIYGSLVSGGASSIPYHRDYITDGDGAPDNHAIVLASSRLSAPSKIQNLIGHGTINVPFTASPWVDVDNLPQAAGKPLLSGDWVNRSTPTVAGMYSKSLIPKWNGLKVKTSGRVDGGTATYTYFTQCFFGLVGMYHGAYSQVTSSASRSCYSMAPLPSMCGTAPAVNKVAGYWRSATYDAGKTIVEDITMSKLDVKQISASCAYDETSFIVVKKNMLILYSVGGGEYWKFKGAFTDIHQIAVLNGKIYAACRNTGLYIVDPVTSTAVTSISNPAVGIDLSRCFGVARGFGNTLWAVGVNGLMKLDGTSWTRYDSGSASPFAAVGVSDGKWSNIDYLKVDALSSDFEMFLVRRLDADVNQASFGVWWSPATGATNGFNDNLTPSMGRPRTNRTHFGGHGGIWAIANGSHKVMTFKSPFASLITGASAIPDGKIGDVYSSIFFVKNSLDQVRFMTMVNRAPLPGVAYAMSSSVVKLVDATATITDTATSGLTWKDSDDYWQYGAYPFGGNGARARSSLESTYGYCDCAASFIMDRGVMITLWCGTENKGNPGSGYTANSGTVDNFFAGVSGYAVGLGLGGGALDYLGQREYGWTGSAWSESVTTPKTMHAAAEPLSEGVSIRFQDVAAGNSFVTPNYYRFGLCEGLLKDNATRHNVNTAFFFRKRVASGDISTPTVPTLTQLPTGLVGVNLSLSSPGVFLNASNQAQFPGECGVQYAIGDKQVTGDFEISYDTTGMSNTAALTTHTNFGVTKKALLDQRFFGFHISNGLFYVAQGSSFTNISVYNYDVTSLKIKRVAGVLTLWVNNTLRLTNNPAVSGIRANDLRLDVVSYIPNNAVPTMCLANRLAPVTVITVNGSDRMAYVGNSTNGSGNFHPRFCAQLFAAETSVNLAGVAATINSQAPGAVDGVVAPLAGQVQVDLESGAYYFNVADEGKAIVSSAIWQQTE